MATNVPNEVFSAVRDKTLYIASHLSEAKLEEGAFPFMHYGKFSRFEFCVIQQNQQGQNIPASAKIRIDEILHMLRISKKAYDMHLENELNGESKEKTLSLAYTIPINGGKFGKKTAAQYLAEHPDTGEADLISQGKWLKENLSRNPKYAPANQKQIDAIKDAIGLLRNGKLDLNNVKSNKVVTLFDGGMRPHMYKAVPPQINQNFHWIYELKVEWEIGAKNPVHITVQNYYAPVIKQENGTLNVQKGQMDKNHFTVNSINLSEDEWMNAVYMIESHMRNFELTHATKSFVAVKNALEANKQN